MSLRAILRNLSIDKQVLTHSFRCKVGGDRFRDLKDSVLANKIFVVSIRNPWRNRINDKSLVNAKASTRLFFTGVEL
jgi:hypothetical protein